MRTPPVTRAFTLVEMIVVIVLIGILAGMVVPRTLSTADRRFDAEARGVERLLTIAGERVGVAGEPVALEFETLSESESRLSLAVLRDRTGQAGGAEWRPDPLVEPAVLVASRVGEARAGGVALPQARWRLVLSPADPRQDITLRLVTRGAGGVGLASGTEYATEVLLPASGVRAMRAVPGRAGAAVGVGAGVPIDLDEIGKGTKPW